MTAILGSERENTILKARARALAEEPPVEGDGADLEVLEFHLAREAYGIESSYVREVYPLKEFTPLPGTPAFVLGIMSVRGQIFSILDLRRLFDLPFEQDGPSATQELAGGATQELAGGPDRVIIAESGTMQVAILAEKINGVRSLPLGDIQQALPTLTGGCAAYLRGVTCDRLALLDIAKLLADPKIVVNED
jgi:purine-binding chemotaxis protein CheW